MRHTDRRRWKLAVIRMLAAEGLHLATVRRTVGSRALNAILDEAYETTSDPVPGAQLVRAQLKERYGSLLDRPIAPWSRE